MPSRYDNNKIHLNQGFIDDNPKVLAILFLYFYMIS